MNTGRFLEARIPPEQMVSKIQSELLRFYDVFGFSWNRKHARRHWMLPPSRTEKKSWRSLSEQVLISWKILRMNPSAGLRESISLLKCWRERAEEFWERAAEITGFNLCDCRQLPFEDKTFDVLINQYLFDILPVHDFFPILAEFKRVLKDGGGSSWWIWQSGRDGWTKFMKKSINWSLP